MSTMTTVGYGDIVPESDAERAFAMVGMVVGGGFYGYVIGIIATLVAVSDANSRAYNEKMGVVNARVRRAVRSAFEMRWGVFLRTCAVDTLATFGDRDGPPRREFIAHRCLSTRKSRGDAAAAAWIFRNDDAAPGLVPRRWLEFNDLPRDLRRKVRSYFKTFLAERSALDEQAILNDLDPGLRAELGQHLIPDAVRASHLFSGLPPTVLAKLSTLLRPVPAAPGDVLQVRGTHGVTMHVVVAGSVDITSDDVAANVVLAGESVRGPRKAPAGAYSPTPRPLGGEEFLEPSSPDANRVASAGDTFGELVVLDLAQMHRTPRGTRRFFAALASSTRTQTRVFAGTTRRRSRPSPRHCT